MGNHYEEPYCQGISFLGDLPNELDPNATEYLPKKLTDNSEEILQIQTDNTILKTSNKSLEIWETTDDEGKLLNGMWFPELNGYLLNNPAQLQLNNDLSIFNKIPGNFPYDLQYISPQMQSFNEISKTSDDTVFLNYDANYNPVSSKTEPRERLEMYTMPSDSSTFNQNTWLPYNKGFTQNPDEFPDQIQFYEQPFLLEMPNSTSYFQNLPYQTCNDGNFNTVNAPNSFIHDRFVPNNYDANNYDANNYVTNSFVPNTYIPNNYAPTNYVQVNNSQAYGLPVPIEKFTYENPANFGLTNMNSQLHPPHNGGTELHAQTSRNSTFNSCRKKPYSSWKPFNKGHSTVPTISKEQSVRTVKYNNQRATEYEKPEFPLNVKENYTRPPYVRKFSKSDEEYCFLTQESSSSMSNREFISGKTEENNLPLQNVKTHKPHPYRKPLTSTKMNHAKDKTENGGLQAPNSKETSLLPKVQKDQSKPFGGFNNFRQPRLEYH